MRYIHGFVCLIDVYGVSLAARASQLTGPVESSFTSRCRLHFAWWGRVQLELHGQSTI